MIPNEPLSAPGATVAFGTGRVVEEGGATVDALEKFKGVGQPKGLFRHVVIKQQTSASVQFQWHEKSVSEFSSQIFQAFLHVVKRVMNRIRPASRLMCDFA